MAPPIVPLVRRLTLADFRSYAALDIRFSNKLVAFTGENGAGKTNLLEALSMFSPGRGLRGAELSACVRHGGGGFAVSIELQSQDHTTQLGHGFDPGGEGRRFRLDRAPAPSARAFADHLIVLWLTPSMDGLFAGSAGERRRFLDRLTLGVDAEHGARVSRFERALRGRNRLLEENGDPRWLSATEKEVAALGVAVAAARLETTRRLAALIEETRHDSSPFPFAQIALAGEIEEMLAQEPAFTVEERFRALLQDNRRRDAAAGRALIGPQASDLRVRHGPKGEAAHDCSTGEQKALLIGLVLAHATLVAESTGIVPLLLLDEVVAHLDPGRRAALFAELAKLGAQVWLTGADPQAFGNIGQICEIFDVENGRVSRRS